jgi:hypothetical protein
MARATSTLAADSGIDPHFTHHPSRKVESQALALAVRLAG